MIEVEMSIT